MGCHQGHGTSLNVGTKLIISRQRYKMNSYGERLLTGNRRPIYVAYQTESIPMTLNDLGGQFCCL